MKETRLVLFGLFSTIVAENINLDWLDDKAKIDLPAEDDSELDLRPANWYCTKSVDRLKDGPEDINSILSSDQVYVDESFRGNETIWWDGFTDFNGPYGRYWQNFLGSFDEYFEYDRWSNIYPDIGLFDEDGTVDWTEAMQGGLGTCYIKAAMGSLGEFPELVRGAFVNPERNEQGIYGVKFYIRGKPWVVTVDDQMLFYKDEVTQDGERHLVFAQPSSDGKSIWGAVLEKAWAKVKSNYIHSEAGLMPNGIRALTGVPAFEYWTQEVRNRDHLQEAFDRMREAEEKGYIMAITTGGTGDDSQYNDCGIAMSHAYSLISVFTMTDARGREHNCMLIRNPWGMNGYSGRWSHDDPNWTQEMVDQVPHGFDPRQDPEETGLFVAPIDIIKNGLCFDTYVIGHLRDDEGYGDVWYDQLNANDRETYWYIFTPPVVDGEIYMTVETYSYNIVPEVCTTDTVDGYYGTTPFVYFQVYDGGEEPVASYHWDYQHVPLLLKDYEANNQLEIAITYEWYGSPANDFTVKVYSKHNGTELTDEYGNTNMLYTDGREPSEFTVNNIDDYWNWYFEGDEQLELSDDEIIWTIGPSTVDYDSAVRSTVFSLAAASLAIVAVHM